MGAFIDITGQKFNRWTVLELVIKGKNIQSKWKCQCDCGEISIITITDLRNGKSSKCKKCAGNETSARVCIDLSGQKIGKWTVLHRTGTTKYRRPIWKCLCECGGFGEIPSSNLINRFSLCCGKCNQFEGIKGNTWSRIVHSAESRNLEFTINLEYIWNLWLEQEGKCALSGILLTLSEKANDKHTASLDRIDSSIGYVEGNVQWVHKDINRMKWIFSNSEFIEICHMVSNKHKKEEGCCYLNDYSVFEKRYEKPI